SKEVEGMNMRPKDPARVRVDALHVAARKLADGCRSCADAYVNVARRNGAGEEEVHGVYASSSPRPEPTKSAPVAGFFGTSSMGERARITTTDRNAGDNVTPCSIMSRRGVVLPTSVSGVVAPRVFGHTSVPEIRTPLSYEEKVWRIAKWRRERGYPFDIHELPSPEDARQRKKLCDGGGGGNRTRTSRATCFARALGRQGSQRWSLVTVGSLALVLHLSRWFRAATQSHRLSSTRRAPEYDSDARIATPCSAFSSVAIRKPSSCGPPKAG